MNIPPAKFLKFMILSSPLSVSKPRNFTSFGQILASPPQCSWPMNMPPNKINEAASCISCQESSHLFLLNWVSCSPWDELNSYQDVENNEIVRRAKKMVWQAQDMYDFVRGRSWRVRTTQGREREDSPPSKGILETSNSLHRVTHMNGKYIFH